VFYLHRWEKIVDKGGSFREKLDEIGRKVKDKFDEALREGDPIHDLDVQRWAVEVNDTVHQGSRVMFLYVLYTVCKTKSLFSLRCREKNVITSNLRVY